MDDEHCAKTHVHGSASAANCLSSKRLLRASTAKAGHPRFSFVLLLGLILFAAPLIASLNPAKPLHQFVRQNWQTEQGLPQNSVLSIAQTADGYLWLGTEEGLSRYDGARFTTFDTSNSGLKDNIVKALRVDGRKRLWIGTQSGGIATYRDGQFSQITELARFGKFSVSCLYEDSSGVIWVGTEESGLIEINGASYRQFTVANGLSDNGITALAGSADGTLWIASANGLTKRKDQQFSRFGVAEGLTSADVRCLEVDHQGTLWAGTAKGLNHIEHDNVTQFTIKDGLVGNEITSLREDGAHSLWIGVGQKGLNRFSAGTFSSSQTDKVFTGTDIDTIFEDRAGDIWVGTSGRGVIALKEGTFTTLTTSDGLPSNVVLPILQDKHGAIWVGTDHGLTRFSQQKWRTFTTADGLASDFIFSLAEDASGVIWVGTRQGINQIQEDTVRAFPEQSSLPSPAARAIFPDSHGVVWIATRAGLSRYDGKSLVTYTTDSGLSDNGIRSIQEDRAGVLWLGTSAGLTMLSEGKFHSYTTADGLSSNDIMGIYCDKDNAVWLATTRGIDRLVAGRISAFNKADRTLDLAISTIVEDRDNFLWLTSNRGIIRLAKEELNRYANGAPDQSVHPVWFGLTDGMKSPECNGGFQPAGWAATDGRLYFPTATGMAVADLNRVPHLEAQAPVIERLIINGLEFPPGKAAAVLPGPGKLEMQFTLPDLHYQNKIHFRYLLEGFDKDWLDADSQRTAHYTNIPHGEYRFRIQPGIGSFWGKEFSSSTLTLQPHFYETRGFFIFMAILLLSIAGATYRIRMDKIASRELKLRALVDQRTRALQESEAQLRQSRDELEVRVKDRTKELTLVNYSLEEEIKTRQQTEELLILAKEAAEAANRAKSQFLTNMSHELRTPINGILGMTEITLTTDLDAEQTEYLEVAKLSADSLLAIVNDILDFSKIEARKLQLENTPFQLRKTVNDLYRAIQIQTRQKGLQFEMAIDPAIPDQLIGDSLRLRQVLLNLLDNAVKFTKTGAIDLIVNRDAQCKEFVTVHFEVRDTGIGIAPEKREIIFEAFSQADNSSTRRYGGTGLGLTISHELAVMLGGKLWVESVPAEGSTFHFTAKLQLAETPRHFTTPEVYEQQLHLS